MNARPLTLAAKEQHTPGEWKVVPDLRTDNLYLLWDKDDNYPADTSDEAMLANAMLMQAAPDLLAALQDCLEYIPKRDRPVLRQKVMDAMAKATGAS